MMDRQGAARCPRCGGEAFLVGPSNDRHPAAYRCYSHGEYTFDEGHCGLSVNDVAEMRRVDAESKAQSRHGKP